MKKLLIATLIGLTLVGCQEKKELSFKETIQLTQELQEVTTEFAQTLTGTETYDEILQKSLVYANDFYEIIEERGLQGDLTKEEIEEYITKYIETTFGYMNSQEYKLQKEQEELERIKEEYNKYKAGSPIYKNRGF